MTDEPLNPNELPQGVPPASEGVEGERRAEEPATNPQGGPDPQQPPADPPRPAADAGDQQDEKGSPRAGEGEGQSEGGIPAEPAGNSAEIPGGGNHAEMLGGEEPGGSGDAPEEPAPEPPPARPAKKSARKKGAEADDHGEPAPAEPKSDKMDWYVLKVQSNREDSIREALQRRVAIAGLDYYFGKIIVPVEKVVEYRGGRRRVVKRKLLPGYLVVQMEVNDDTWFLIRETTGIGDFTGSAGRPTPMHEHEVARILATHEEKTDDAPKLKIGFRVGDRVKITEGNFENFEGDVESIDETNGEVTVMINIFARSTPVTFKYYQLEKL